MCSNNILHINEFKFQRYFHAHKQTISNWISNGYAYSGMLNSNTNKGTTLRGISFSTHKNHVDSCICVWNKLLQYKIYLHTSFFWWAFFVVDVMLHHIIYAYEYSLWVGKKKWSRDFILQKVPLLGKNLNMNEHRNVCVYLFIYAKEMYVFSRIFIPFPHLFTCRILFQVE